MPDEHHKPAPWELCVNSESIADHETRLRLLEQDRSHMRELWENGMEGLIKEVAEIKKIMERRFEDIDHAIDGNGKPGIIGRLDWLEARSNRLIGGLAAISLIGMVVELYLHIKGAK